MTKREIVYGFFRLRTLQKIDIITALGGYPDYYNSVASQTDREKAFLHDLHENDSSAFYEGLASRVSALEAENYPIADRDTPKLSLDPRSVEETLLIVAAGHQGGHSATGKLISEVFSIPFPITMSSLQVAAKQLGHNPDDLWPWWREMKNDEARALARMRKDIHQTEPSIDDIAETFLKENGVD